MNARGHRPPTLLLLHPLPLDASVWPRALWRPGRAVVAPTLYGFGGSIEAWARGALACAGDGSLVVVGCSVGGSTALEVARLAPDRVASMVLIGTKPGHRPEPRFRDEAVRVLESEGIDAAWARYWAPLFAPSADPAVVARARHLARALGVEPIVRGVRVFHGRPDRTDLARDLDLPVFVVSGEHDRTSVAAPFPHATFHRVAGAGHYVPLERPDEVVAVVEAAVDRASRVWKTSEPTPQSGYGQTGA